MRSDGSPAEGWLERHEGFGNTLRGVGRRGIAGVGFVLGAGVLGIDLDQCRNPETGELEPWAARIVAGVRTYWEASPSGTGVHGYCFGVKPADSACNMRFGSGAGVAGFEWYDRDRWFVVTGRHLAGTPADVCAVSDARLVALYAFAQSLAPKKATKPAAPIAPRVVNPVTLDDRDLLGKMFSSRNGSTVARLWHGQHSFPSQSDADIALCGTLAFWTGCDPGRIDTLFRQSALWRPKWDEPRKSKGVDTTYGAMTIAAAIARCGQTFGDSAR